MMREAVPLAALVSHREPVLLPGLKKQRDHPVIENVEEFAERVVFRAHPADHQLGVIVRQDPKRAGKTHEIHAHARWLSVAASEGVDLAGRKRNRRLRAKM